MKRTMLSIADERIILTDSTKFQKVARCQIAPISMVDQIITDLKLSDYHFEKFAAQDILVERV